MNINAERFFALTALLAAPLVAAPACVINDSDDDAGSNSNSNANTDSTDPSTTMTGTDTVDPSATTTPATDSTTVGTGDTTGDDPTGGTTDDPTGDTTDGTTGGNELGNCCEPDGMTAGCEVPEVQDCVCEADPFCCDDVWDATCAGEVVSLGCGECNFPPAPLDCYCLATCDGKTVDGPWQVCGGDPVAAAADGQAACEDDLSTQGCMKFSCDECDCFTAEVPEIDCK